MRVLIALGDSLSPDPGVLFGSHLASRLRIAPTIIAIARRESQRSSAEQSIDSALDALGSDLPGLDRVVKVGNPAAEIIREADAGGHDLVIVSDRHHPGLSSRFFVSSTAVRVVEHASCPVVVARGRVALPQRVLLCDSGAPTSNLLCRFVDQLGPMIREGDELTLLHVMSQMEVGPGVDAEPLLSSADDLMACHAPEGELLQRDISLLASLHVVPRPLVRRGLVTDQILGEARAGRYDLVVIGAHVGTGWRRILLDDIAHEVIVRIDRPLLVVR